MLAESEEDGLPDVLSVTKEDIEIYFDLWTLWRATDRKFLPSQLMAEPERPLRVLLELDGIHSMLELQKIKRESAEKNNDRLE